MDERDKREAQRVAEIVTQTRQRLLGMDQPWPATDVVAMLCAAADHLLSEHDCDHHGYERIMAARDAGRELLKTWANEMEN